MSYTASPYRGTTPTFAAGKFGQALATGLMAIPALPAANVGTIETWVNTTATGTYVALGNDNSPGTGLIWLGQRGGNAELGVPGGAIGGQGTGSPIAINNGAWHHLAATYDGTNVKLWVDGALSYTLASSQTLNFGSGTTVIGAYGASTGYDWVGLIDEIRISSSVRYAAPFTPPSGPFDTDGDTIALYHLEADGSDSSSASPGTFSLSESATAVAIAVAGSAGIDSFSFYRSPVANFTPGPGTLLATQAGASYADSTAVAATTYYYKVTGVDTLGASHDILPAGLANASTSAPLSLSGRTLLQPIVLGGIGDSITYGVQADPGIGPIGPLADYLSTVAGLRSVPYVNGAVGGTTTSDWLPSGSHLPGVVAEIAALAAANPGCPVAVNLMLGTNDAAFAVSASDYGANMQAIVAYIHAEIPQAVIPVHTSPWFSPNAHNSNLYDEAANDRLRTYRPAVAALIAANAFCHPGDTQSYDFMAAHYITDLTPETTGSNGTFFLHPTHLGNVHLGGNLWGPPNAAALGLVPSAGAAAGIFSSPVFQGGF